MIFETHFDKARDIKPVDVLPLEAYDTAIQYRTGVIPADAVTSNKTFNGATLGQIKGRITDPFLEMEVAKLPDLFSASKNSADTPSTDNADTQK